MWNIIGHERAVALLRGAVDRDAVPHALLIEGPAGIGKRTLARELARATQCTGTEPPCGACVHCRQVAAGTHPDVTVVEPAEGKDMISIEQVRSLRDVATLRPFQGRFRVTVIRGAEALTAQAADALLKILEEPPPHVLIVLTAADAESVPATVRSRCRVLSLRPIDASTIQSALEARGVAEDMAADLARLARGSIGWALQAAATPRLAAERREAVERMSAVFDLDLAGRLDLAERLTVDRKLKAGIRRNLEVLLLVARDLLRLNAGIEPALVAGVARERLEVAGGRYTLEQINLALRAMEVVMARVDANVDPRLALEALMVGLP